MEAGVEEELYLRRGKEKITIYGGKKPGSELMKKTGSVPAKDLRES